MNFTENAKSKFWADLSAGIRKTFNHDIGEAFHIDQYKSGRFTFTESVTGGAGAVIPLIDSLKASSPIIESVRMTPVSQGYNAVYNVSVEFDPMKAESIYSNGQTAMATVDVGGKKFIVDNDGNKIKQVKDEQEADKYIANMNKTTGSNLKKAESADEDGFPIDLESVIALANEALEGTDVSVAQEDGKLVLKGSDTVIKPTQEFLPAPYYGADSLEGGYNDDTGAVEVSVPEYLSDYELEALRDFLIKAVNYVIDSTCCSTENCEDDEWCDAMDAAEPDENYVTKYNYKGESFVGNDKKEVATLFKSLLQENVDEAKKMASKFMSAEMVEGFARKYANAKVVEKHTVILPEEMALLDRIHESAANRAPEKAIEMDALVAKNMNNKEK